MPETRFLVATAALVLFCGCAIPMAAPAAPAAKSAAANTPSPYSAYENRIFQLINAERARRGIRPLAYNADLDRMAKIQATNMAHFQKMAHVLPEARLPSLDDRAHYVGYGYQEIAENIALGYPSAESVVQGWMNSSGHRRNILNPGVVETGIGIARSSAGGIYYAQVFGSRLSLR
ncbi:MAG TPA: CAP domain-containing protein [Gemmatimonadaceae bacterium]|nr:CAP domain-containing protein [Gemmatimonadaceae bacterium]